MKAKETERLVAMLGRIVVQAGKLDRDEVQVIAALLLNTVVIIAAMNIGREKAIEWLSDQINWAVKELPPDV